MVLRQQVWIDRNVQGVLVGRIVLYWISALLYVGLGTACFQYYQHTDWSAAKHLQVLFSQFWPWLPSAILCLPLVIFDVVRLSNLFVGPIYRLRNHLAQLNDDPHCRSLKFRDDDYWQDLVEPIHCLQAELQILRAEVSRLRQAAISTAPATQPMPQPMPHPLDLLQVGLERIERLLPTNTTPPKPAQISK